VTTFLKVSFLAMRTSFPPPAASLASLPATTILDDLSNYNPSRSLVHSRAPSLPFPSRALNFFGNFFLSPGQMPSFFFVSFFSLLGSPPGNYGLSFFFYPLPPLDVVGQDFPLPFSSPVPFPLETSQLGNANFLFSF